MTTLKQGDKAPFFTGIDQYSNTVKLDYFNGSKLVLYFYPKDNTPGCTAEACSLRDANVQLLQKNFRIVGVSKDSITSHKKFVEKFSLPFSLIADEEKIILNAYGVWGPKKFMGKTIIGTIRTTFVISENGIIEHVIDDVKTKNHGEQILDLYL